MERSHRHAPNPLPGAMPQPLPSSASAGGVAAGGGGGLGVGAGRMPDDAKSLRIQVAPQGSPVYSLSNAATLLGWFPEATALQSARRLDRDETGRARKVLGEEAAGHAARRAQGMAEAPAQSLASGATRVTDRKASLPSASAVAVGYAACEPVLFGADADAARLRWSQLISGQCLAARGAQDPISVSKTLMSQVLRTPCPAGMTPAAHEQRLAALVRGLARPVWTDPDEAFDRHSQLLEAVCAAGLPTRLLAAALQGFSSGIGLGRDKAASAWLATEFVAEEEWLGQGSPPTHAVFNALLRELLVNALPHDSKGAQVDGGFAIIDSYLQHLQQHCADWGAGPRTTVYLATARALMAHVDPTLAEPLLRALVVHPQRPLLSVLTMKALARECRAAGSAAMDARVRDLFLCANADFWHGDDTQLDPANLLYLAIGHAAAQREPGLDASQAFKQLKAQADGLPASAWREQETPQGQDAKAMPGKKNPAAVHAAGPLPSQARQLWGAGVRIAGRPLLALRQEELITKSLPPNASPEPRTASLWLFEKLPWYANTLYTVATLARLEEGQSLGGPWVRDTAELFVRKGLGLHSLAAVSTQMQALGPGFLTPEWHTTVREVLAPAPVESPGASVSGESSGPGSPAAGQE